MNSQNSAIHSTQNNIHQLPEMCFVFIESNGPGKYIGIVKRGERGYYPTSYDIEDMEHAKSTVEHMNEKLEVTKLQAECMSNGSLFGWDSLGSNPEYVAKQMPHLV